MTDRTMLYKLLSLQAKRVGTDAQDIPGVVDAAISLGIGDCWEAHNWPFKRRQFTVAVVSGTTRYAISAEITKVEAIADPESPDGREITYVDKGVFDQRLGSQTNYLHDYPYLFTVYDDMAEGGAPTRYLEFSPPPNSAYTMTVLGHTAAPNDPSSIPQLLNSLLYQCCARYLYRPHEMEFINATNMMNTEVRRLVPLSKPYGGPLGRMRLSHERETRRVEWPWVG